MTDIRNPLAAALAKADRTHATYAAGELEALRELAEAVRLDLRVNPPGELRASGVLDDPWQSRITLAGDYARWAAEKMNAGGASDTEFIADGATVTAYVHCLAHMSATFTLDEGRPYPGGTG